MATTAASSAAHPLGPDGAAAPAGRSYLVLLISLVTASQIADRQMLSIVMEPIKREFGLSDAQLGFLNGTVFSIAYALGAIPLAVLADRWSRKKVVAATLACWSAFTAATMAATSYLGLAVTRFLVGLGESGAGPASLAMLAGRFPQEKRAGVVALLTSVSAVAAFGAFWGAGFVVEHFGWRRMFLIFGLPGVVLAVVFWLTIPERSDARPGGRSALTARELRPVVLNAPMLHLFAAASWNGIIGNALASWTPSYLIRTFGLPMSRVGFWLGLSGVMSGLVGALLGGYLADRISGRDRLGAVRVALWVLTAYLPLSLLTYLVRSEPIALGLLMSAAVLVGMSSAPIAAQFLNFMPQESRSTAMAILSTGILLVAGLGASLAGLISDKALALGHQSGLQIALVMVAAAGIFPIVHLRAIRRHASRDPDPPNVVATT